MAEPQLSRRCLPYVEAGRREVVRDMATSRPALSLPAHIARAAARDPGLEWNPATYRYCRKAAATPALSTATEGRGGVKK